MEGIIGIICNKSRRFSAGIEYLPVLMKKIINGITEYCPVQYNWPGMALQDC